MILYFYMGFKITPGEVGSQFKENPCLHEIQIVWTESQILWTNVFGMCFDMTSWKIWRDTHLKLARSAGNFYKTFLDFTELRKKFIF